ncbi:MAG: ion transporter [Methanospirillum sp.]|uniref:ion transporter n=1 Tax=Methanospirillum sp. TaxID=45200 RepID=UPI0023757F6D|nr:ion transporter [Methanospirillum sp.]MDD1728527.1 ion transporter [Methanospirillum sp.]
MSESIKKRVFDIVNDRDNDGIPNHIFDYAIITLIVLNIIAIFLETYKPIYTEYYNFFTWFEYFSVILFTVEYILRIWTCTYYEEYTNPVIGRLRYAISLMMIIDFFAVFPFYLSLLLPLDPRVVKLFRMFRLFRIFKLFRYYKSFEVVISVLKKNKDYLISVLIILISFLIFVSYSIYIIESESQPDKFQDFDNAFWWSVITLTTVGYGDTYPITDIGKFLTVIVLLIGIGLISLPTGIIASGFLDEVRKRKECSLSIPENSIADEIRKLYQLKEDGIISEEEYQRMKEKLVAK